ncbi:MAG: hypothetical protein OXQ29_27820 [Rhodospirillaceae bacterium]|nr:hypothetical protein [Rhodospirillaceae bacterium]
MKFVITAAVLLALLVVPSGVMAQMAPAPTVPECSTRLYVQDGDVFFDMPDLSEYGQVEQRGHYVHVWVEEDDGSLGSIRNEINGPEFGVVRVRFGEADRDKWFHYRQGSYARKTLLDYVSPVTGRWYFDYSFPFRCVTEGRMRIPE